MNKLTGRGEKSIHNSFTVTDAATKSEENWKESFKIVFILIGLWSRVYCSVSWHLIRFCGSIGVIHELMPTNGL